MHIENVCQSKVEQLVVVSTEMACHSMKIMLLSVFAWCETVTVCLLA